jgi:cell division protease FtsH
MMGKTALIQTIAMTLGGRAAEDLVFHEVTTGASNDLEKVTDIAKRMVMRYGMSDKLGPRVLGHSADMPFLGLKMGHQPDYSEDIAREIDDEVRRIIEEGYESALNVLREHVDDLHRISQILIGRETIDKDQFVRLLAGETEDQVFEEEVKQPSPEPAAQPRTRAPRQPRPFPLPGSAMQPPEPNAAN